jgi:hypothetical protein
MIPLPKHLIRTPLTTLQPCAALQGRDPPWNPWTSTPHRHVVQASRTVRRHGHLDFGSGANQHQEASKEFLLGIGSKGWPIHMEMAEMAIKDGRFQILKGHDLQCLV